MAILGNRQPILSNNFYSTNCKLCGQLSDDNPMSYVLGDTEDRGDVAVLASLTESGGATRIVFDDVARQPMLDGLAWTHRALFTVAQYPTEDLDRLALSKDEFARIGENVIIRLLALAGRLRDGT